MRMAVLEKLAAEPPLRIDAAGVVRVGATRVTLDPVVAEYEEGATAEEIVIRYDSLPLGDVYSAIGYYLRNREAVQEYLARRSEQSEVVHQENLRRSPTAGLRDRLLGRRASTQVE
jgi:uncharacterized protein (DUF433 family)